MNARLLGCLSFVVTAAGCGPVRTTLTLSDAEVAIETALAADAQTYALYDLTAARAYYDKAREEEGYSDFEAATRLAGLAIDRAQRARDAALSAPERGTRPAKRADEAPEDDFEDAPVGASGSQL